MIQEQYHIMLFNAIYLMPFFKLYTSIVPNYVES